MNRKQANVLWAFIAIAFALVAGLMIVPNFFHHSSQGIQSETVVKPTEEYCLKFMYSDLGQQIYKDVCAPKKTPSFSALSRDWVRTAIPGLPVSLVLPKATAFRIGYGTGERSMDMTIPANDVHGTASMDIFINENMAYRHECVLSHDCGLSFREDRQFSLVDSEVDMEKGMLIEHLVGTLQEGERHLFGVHWIQGYFAYSLWMQISPDGTDVLTINKAKEIVRSLALRPDAKPAILREEWIAVQNSYKPELPDDWKLFSFDKLFFSFRLPPGSTPKERFELRNKPSILPVRKKDDTNDQYSTDFKIATLFDGSIEVPEQKANPLVWDAKGSESRNIRLAIYHTQRAALDFVGYFCGAEPILNEVTVGTLTFTRCRERILVSSGPHRAVAIFPDEYTTVFFQSALSTAIAKEQWDPGEMLFDDLAPNWIGAEEDGNGSQNE